MCPDAHQLHPKGDEMPDINPQKVVLTDARYLINTDTDVELSWRIIIADVDGDPVPDWCRLPEIKAWTTKNTIRT